jgi:hypothetical protein
MVSFLFDKSPLKAEVLARIHKDKTIGEPLREKALLVASKRYDDPTHY